MTDNERDLFQRIALRNLIASIHTQLRAKPLGVDVPDAWIRDLAANAMGGMLEAYHVTVDDVPAGLACDECGMDLAGAHDPTCSHA